MVVCFALWRMPSGLNFNIIRYIRSCAYQCALLRCSYQGEIFFLLESHLVIMAKKISKHSRAARREQAEEPETAELAKLPRIAEKKDIASYLVRTANKNEDLLKQKLEKKKLNARNKDAKITKGNKDKVNKGLLFGGRLSTKIQKSINRGLKVQQRRSTWDQVNSDLKNIDNNGNIIITKKVNHNKPEVSDSEEEEEEEEKSQKTDFSVLEEIEA